MKFYAESMISKKSPISLVKPINSDRFETKESDINPYRRNWVSVNQNKSFELPPIFRPETATTKSGNRNSTELSSRGSSLSQLASSRQFCVSDNEAPSLSQVSSNKSSVDLMVKVPVSQAVVPLFSSVKEVAESEESP